jgi:spore coat polysaccharide biosynthesis protein SpsF
MTVALIVQARMTSTRLPGKVLLPIAGRPMLSYQMERLRQVRSADVAVVATTVNEHDEPIVQFCKQEGLNCTRGPEMDVLRRYHDTATLFDAATVVRVTSDCPLIDPDVVDHMIRTYAESRGELDYASNMLEPSYPYGMAVEVMSARALAEANDEARDPVEREHVTPFLYRHPQRYRLKSVRLPNDLSGHRWTVDTPEDFELVRRVLEALYPKHPDFRMNDVLTLLERHPQWRDLNRHVHQKALGE